MELRIDLAAPSVRLGDADDTDRCVVVVSAPADATAAEYGHRLGHLLVTAGMGTSADGVEALLLPDALAFRAAGEVGGDWAERLAALVARQRRTPGDGDGGPGAALPGALAEHRDRRGG